MPITNISITDTLGYINNKTSFAFIEDSIKAFINQNDVNVNFTKSANNIKFTFNNIIYPKDVLIISYLIKPNIENEIIKSTITVSSTNITNSKTIELKPKKYANISINKKISDEKIVKNENFNIYYEIINNGNIEAKNLILTDQLPQDFSLLKICLNKEGIESVLDKNYYTLNNNTISIFNQNYSLLINPNETVTLYIYGVIK